MVVSDAPGKCGYAVAAAGWDYVCDAIGRGEVLGLVRAMDYID